MERNHANTDAQRAPHRPGILQIAAAELFIVATCVEETTREIVTEYQSKILAEHKWMADEKWRIASSRRQPDWEILNNPITNPAHSYLLSDSDAKAYFAECDKEAARIGLHIETPDGCPLLEAESDRRRAEKQLLDAMSLLAPELRGIDKLANQELRKTAIELSVRMCAPFIRPAAEIIKGMK